MGGERHLRFRGLEVGRVPDPDRPINPRTHQDFPVRGELQVGDGVARVTFKVGVLLPRTHVVDADMGIVAPGREVAVVRRERHPVDLVGMLEFVEDLGLFQVDDGRVHIFAGGRGELTVRRQRHAPNTPLMDRAEGVELAVIRQIEHAHVSRTIRDDQLGVVWGEPDVLGVAVRVLDPVEFLAGFEFKGPDVAAVIAGDDERPLGGPGGAADPADV